MKKIACCIVYFFLLTGAKSLIAQHFTSGELSTIKPSQVIIENYIQINLSKEIIDDVMANRFDVNNPYTYLQIVSDEQGNRFHIIFQTGFTGKILFLAYSNNLLGLFNKADKPLFLFNRSLKDINNHISSVQIAEATVKCIIERLNYCSGN